MTLTMMAKERRTTTSMTIATDGATGDEVDDDCDGATGDKVDDNVNGATGYDDSEDDE